MSLNLGRRGGAKRMIGTIYHYGDLYSKMKKTGLYAVREYPAEDEFGNPLYLTREELDKKRKEMGQYVYSLQMLLKPVADENKKFKLEWLSYFEKQPRGITTSSVTRPDRRTSVLTSRFSGDVRRCAGVTGLSRGLCARQDGAQREVDRPEKCSTRSGNR